jgi:hypothetical protein
MRSDFEPKALQKAKETLQKHLEAVQKHKETNETYQKEVFKVSLWERIKRLLRF